MSALGLLPRFTFFVSPPNQPINKSTLSSSKERLSCLTNTPPKRSNKVGMGLEDWNMQKDYGFGVFVWSVTEVVGVAIGSQAADDFGAGWGVNGKAL